MIVGTRAVAVTFSFSIFSRRVLTSSPGSITFVPPRRKVGSTKIWVKWVSGAPWAKISPGLMSPISRPAVML